MVLNELGMPVIGMESVIKVFCYRGSENDCFEVAYSSLHVGATSIK